MAQSQPIQTNFTAGELSPRMKGRVDIARYANGVALLQNFIILPQGGVYRRSGTIFAAELRDSSKKGRLVRFEFSTTQAYILQFEDSKIRFYKDEAIITEAAKTITGATKANPGVINSTAHGFSNGDRVIISGIVGMTELNNREFEVTGASVNSFSLLGEDTTNYTTYVSGGEVAKIYEVSTTYLESELPNLQFTQSADVLYIAHTAHAPATLSRTGHTSWTLANITFIDGPYMSEQTDVTITPSGTTGSVTLTASASKFSSTDVGRQIRMLHGSSWSYATITAYTSPTQVTATVGSQATSASASSKYRLGAFYTGNYPQCVVFHEQRLIFAGTPAESQSFWLSMSGDYTTYSPTTLGTTTVVDSSGFSATIVSNRVNGIRWMVSGAVLSLGTNGGEWQIKAGSVNEAITPTNFGMTEQTAWGSRLIQAVKVGSAVLFIDRSGRSLREYQYNFQIDSFVAKELSLLGEHLLREGDYIVDMAYQQSPDSVLWLVRADGVLVGLTYLQEQEIVGFHRHIFGGSFQGSNAVVESVAVIPNPETTGDQLWLIVKRTINGSTKRYVEFMDDPFLPANSTDKASMNFVDCGLSYDGTAATTVTGLTHLAGEEVAILGDESVRPSKTVSTTGSVTLDATAETAKIGLAFSSIIHTLPLEGGNPLGTAQGKIKRVHRVAIRVLDSLTLQFSTNPNTYEIFAFRSTSDPMGQSPPLFTGDKNLELTMDYESEGDYYIKQSNPYPLTVLSLMPKYKVTET